MSSATKPNYQSEQPISNIHRTYRDCHYELIANEKQCTYHTQRKFYTNIKLNSNINHYVSIKSSSIIQLLLDDDRISIFWSHVICATRFFTVAKLPRETWTAPGQNEYSMEYVPGIIIYKFVTRVPHSPRLKGKPPLSPPPQPPPPHGPLRRNKTISYRRGRALHCRKRINHPQPKMSSCTSRRPRSRRLRRPTLS